MGKARPLEDQFLQLSRRNKEGSGLTRNGRENVLVAVAKDLKEDFKLKRIDNLKAKHVKHLIEKWKKQGLSVGTIKNRASHLRWAAEKLGKQPMIPRDNEALGIDKRVIDYNTDKAWEPSAELKSDLPETQKFHVELMREFGMRFEEAAKFRPHENVSNEGKVSIIYGTKGGRPRDMNHKIDYVKAIQKDDKHGSEDKRTRGEARTFQITERQLEVVNNLKTFLDSKNVETLSYQYNSYQSFKNATRYIYEKNGMTKNGIGTPHGLRHCYAQERYEALTGWKPPAALNADERKEFRSSMTKEMKELERQVKKTISYDLGHGRDQVTSNYVGSWKS